MRALCCLWLLVVACEPVKNTPSDGPPGGGDGAQVACTTNAQCSGDTPVCDTAAMVCVGCLPGGNTCTGTAPVCDTDKTCRACEAHDECMSGVCLPDGGCGDAAMVAFIDGTAVGSTTCTRAQPCSTFAAALATGRSIIKLRGTVVEPVTIANRNIVILAEPSATLRTNGDVTSVALTVNGTSRVEIHDLTITHPGTAMRVPTATTVNLFLNRVKLQGNGNGGLVLESGTATIARSTIANNTGAGGIAHQGGSLTVTASTFSGNSGGAAITSSGAGTLTVSRSSFLNNINGGLWLFNPATFAIVGNVFFGNGGASSSIGGITVEMAGSTGRIELNTFVQNRTQTGTTGSALHCVAGAYAMRSNILANNNGGPQFGGTCTHSYTLAFPGAVPAGATNKSGDPLFIDAATGNLHLMSGSPARGGGDPATDLSGIAGLDIDGDARTNPPDMGADQYKP